MDTEIKDHIVGKKPFPWFYNNKKGDLIRALLNTPQEGVFSFIRANLDHRSSIETHGECRYRFDMSYNAPINNKILNIFEPLGIRNAGCQVVLSFWKGNPDLYFINLDDEEIYLKKSFSCGNLNGYKTTWLIYLIFENTIFRSSLNRFAEEEDIKEFDFVGLNYLNWSTELQLHYFDEKKATDFEIKKEEQEELKNPTTLPF